MKKILLLSLVILLCNCVPSPVERYLKVNNPNSSIDIVEESTEDSVYFPYDTFLSLDASYSDLLSNIKTLEGKALASNTKIEKTEYLNKINHLLTIEKDKLDSIYKRCCLLSEKKIYQKGEDNRKSIKIKYKINGEIKVERFYFNSDGKSIEHQDSDNFKIREKILEIRESIVIKEMSFSRIEK